MGRQYDGIRPLRSFLVKFKDARDAILIASNIQALFDSIIIYSLWRRANARNVSFPNLTVVIQPLSTRLIKPNSYNIT